jgi:hypothetical protein
MSGTPHKEVPEVSKLATAQPATAQPATAKPATAKPATAQPATAKPSTAKPSTAKPATAKHATVDPEVVKEAIILTREKSKPPLRRSIRHDPVIIAIEDAKSKVAKQITSAEPATGAFILDEEEIKSRVEFTKDEVTKLLPDVVKSLYPKGGTRQKNSNPQGFIDAMLHQWGVFGIVCVGSYEYLAHSLKVLIDNKALFQSTGDAAFNLDQKRHVARYLLMNVNTYSSKHVFAMSKDCIEILLEFYKSGTIGTSAVAKKVLNFRTYFHDTERKLISGGKVVV